VSAVFASFAARITLRELDSLIPCDVLPTSDPGLQGFADD
jgi:hypothetical protein